MNFLSFSTKYDTYPKIPLQQSGGQQASGQEMYGVFYHISELLEAVVLGNAYGGSN